MQQQLKFWVAQCLRMAALLTVFIGAHSWAQTAPNILVLTTHEGLPSPTTTGPYQDDGLYASNGLARAFGYSGAIPGNYGPSTNAYLRTTPTVTYEYGALSIRQALPEGVASSPSSRA